MGFIDTKNGRKTYNTTRNDNRREIFRHPKYNSAIGISKSVIDKYLIPNKVEIVKFWIIGFEKKSFYCIIPLKEFLEKGKEINFCDRQIILAMNEFTRLYQEQGLLP